MNRRDLMKLGGLTASSYFLPSLRRAHAATIPKRFLIFYTQHGTLPWLWRPRGTPDSFGVGPLLAPLEPYKKDLIFIDGLDFKGLKGPGSKDHFPCGHARGQSSSLTAHIQTEGGTCKSGGPSIDYYIADGLKTQNGGKPVTAVPNVQAAIVEASPALPTWGQPYQQIPGKTILPERDALAVFNRLFPNGAPSGMPAPSVPDRESLQRKAVLDFVNEELKVVGDRYGEHERVRLEQHATLVSDLKQRLDVQSMPGAINAACKAPTGVRANKKQRDWYDPLIWETTRPTVPQLMQAAFACDITRIFAIHVEDPPGRLYGGHPGFENPHALVHALRINNKDGNPPNVLNPARGLYMEYAKIFKEVLDLLSAVKEADGNSMLYHTCVLWCGELAHAGHMTTNSKWLTAGQLGGYLKTGQWLPYDGDLDGKNNDGMRGVDVPSNGDVFTTIANGMGVPTSAFGVNTRGEIAAMKA